jgi:hypothetical protein
MFRKIFIFTILTLVFISCGNKKNKFVVSGNEKEEIISGDTSDVKQNKKVASFNSVNITSVSTVDIKIGPECSVSIEGQKAYVDAQHIDSENGTLVVAYDLDNPVTSSTHLVITAPYLDAIKLSRCGMVTVHGNDIKVKNFALDINKISVVKINSKIISNKTILNVNNLMYTSIMTDCDDLLLSTKQISHIQIMGKVKHYKYVGGEKSKVEIKKA